MGTAGVLVMGTDCVNELKCCKIFLIALHSFWLGLPSQIPFLSSLALCHHNFLCHQIPTCIWITHSNGKTTIKKNNMPLELYWFYFGV